MSAPCRRAEQLAMASPGVAIGPPDLLLARPDLWEGQPWVVDMLTPTVAETACRFPGDEAAAESALALERAALLLGGAFVVGAAWQWEPLLSRHPDLADRLAAAPKALLPPLPAAGVSPGPPGDLLLWGGGAWDWLDLASFAAALARPAAGGRPGLVLADRYEGAWRPTPAARRAPATPALSRNPHTPHEGFLAATRRAAAWVCLHPAGSPEAPAAFRTRLLDAAAAARPVVVSPGEGLGDLLVAAGGGWHAPADPNDLADLLGGLGDEELAERGLACAEAARGLPRQPLPILADLLAPETAQVEQEGVFGRLMAARREMGSWRWRLATKLAGRR